MPKAKYPYFKVYLINLYFKIYVLNTYILNTNKNSTEIKRHLSLLVVIVGWHDILEA